MNSNIWYYTLSTIAQTLAAILALGGTFIIFKFNTMKERVDALRDITINMLIRVFQKINSKSFDDMNDNELIRQARNELSRLDNKKMDLGDNDLRTRLIEFFRDITKQNVSYETNEQMITYLKNKIGRFETDNNRKNEVFKYLKISLLFLSLTIIASILFLPLQQTLGTYDKLVLWIVIISTIISIGIQGRIIWLVAYK